MELSTINKKPIATKVILTGGNLKGVTFVKESSDIWVSQWTSFDHPRPKTWLPLRVTGLTIMGGRPETVR